MTYKHPPDAKARVRRATFSLTGEVCWEAAKPGGTYLFGEGLHFDDWSDAIEYVTQRLKEPAV